MREQTCYGHDCYEIFSIKLGEVGCQGVVMMMMMMIMMLVLLPMMKLMRFPCTFV
jgi:hypothetical protein